MAAANPYGLVAVRSRRLRYWWAGLGVLTLLAVYASPVALALRVPSLARATVPAPLPELTLPSIGAPLLRVPTVHPVAPLRVVRPPVAHAVVVPVEAAPVVHHAMRVVRDVHSQVVATSRSSSGAAADPFAHAPVVQDDVGAVATIPAAEVSQSEAVQYSFFSTSDPSSTATSSTSDAPDTTATTTPADTTTTTTPTDTTTAATTTTTATTDTTAATATPDPTTTTTAATTDMTAATAATPPATPWNVTLTDPTSHAISLGTVSGDLQIAVNGAIVGAQAPGAVSSISIVGVPVFDDTLTVDLSSGPILAPISFDGGAGGDDTLVVTGSTGSFTSTATGPQSGTVTAGPTTITYSNLEPVAGGDSADATLTTTGADDAATLTATATKATLRVTSGTAESTTVDDPTSSLTVDVGAGDDDLTIGDISGYTGALTVDGGAGTDTLTVSSSEAIGYDGSTLTIGSRPIAVESFENLDLTGDGTNAVTISTGDDVTVGGGEISFGGQTVSVSQVSGVAVDGAAPGQTFDVAGVDTASIPQLDLAGSGGGDTYAMGDGFGSVHVAGSASDTLDFSALTHALAYDATTYSDTGDATDVLTVSSPAPATVVWPSVDDHWQQVDAPNPDLSNDVLRGVSCLSDTDCIAVGNSGDDALAAQFDGTGWTDLGAVDAANEQESYLYSVSCPSAAFCVAAGLSGEINDQYTTSLVETWDGSQWQQATLPSDPGEYAHLDSVSCPSASDCMAVGDYYNDGVGGYEPYSFHWDGTAWSAESMSITGVNFTIPDDVSCAGGACMAVGSSESPSTAETVYVEEWDGTSWSLDSGAADPGSTNNTLGAVSCLSATSCVAAGEMDSYYGSGGDNGTMVQTWDGTTWSLVEDTSAAAQGIGIGSIACATATDCTLVGGDSSSGATTFAEEFDGSSLSVDSTPSPAGTARGDQNTLDGVSCATACLAVGGYSWAGSPGRALALTTAAGPFAPGVDLLEPADGALAGGTAVTIRGAGFDGATAVEFGSIAATSFTVVSDDEIDAVAPDCGCSGTTAAGVSITTPVAASTTGHASDVFTYLGQPLVTGVSPSSGVAGTRVVVTGTGFTGVTEVDFGTTSASFVVESDTTIDATAPAGSGLVDVVVTGPGGVSATSAADEFAIVPPPSVTGVAPSSGPSTGGTTIEIYGSGFTGAVDVELAFGDDSVSADDLTVDSDTEITATVPDSGGYTGPADVVVYTPAGGSQTSSDDVFTYEPPQFTVTTTADSDDGACTATLCSLRDAVDASNGAGAGDVTVPAGHYVLTQGPLYVTAGISITGAGARETIVDGNDAEQVIRGDRTNAPSISLTDLTITGGHSLATDAPDYNEGGGIISWGPLTLTRVAVVGNTAYADGGGLFVISDLTIADSTIAENTAGGTNGAFEDEHGSVSVVDSTIADNTSYTGAVGLSDPTAASIVSSTIAGNSSTATGFTPSAIAVGGGADLTLQDDVIANDFANGQQNCETGDPIDSNGYNLDTDGSCGLTATGDQSDAADAGLGALADNGGETDTMLPLAGSPLIDAGGSSCTSTDQRGDARPQGAACDIGAVETAPAAANEPPTASFTSSASGLVVSFDGSGSSDPDGTVVGWAWDFGDGLTGQGETVSHTYAAAGTYTVTLVVTDDGGATGSVAHDVTVAAANQPPVASFTSSANGLVVSFDGSGSSDPDGTVVGWTWDFGDGLTGQGETVSHTYAAAGTYTVTLVVTDDGGATGSVAHDVTVANAPPAAAFTSSSSTLSVFVDASGSSDPDGTIVSYAWSFGDGSTGSGVTAAHLYRAAGMYAVELTVTDNGGATASVTHDVSVQPPVFAYQPVQKLPPPDFPPRASFTVTTLDQSGAVIVRPGIAASGNEATTFAVDASGSTDDHGIVAYTWTFGDGAVASGMKTSHVYGAPGTYTVTLTVRDTSGQSDGTSQSVAVTNAPPQAAFTYGVARALMRTRGSAANPSRTIAFASTSWDDGRIVSYAWTFGDGHRATGPHPTHVYAGTKAHFVATLTVTDNDGATDTVRKRINVAVPPANVIDDEVVTTSDDEATPLPTSVTDIEQIATADGEATPLPTSVTDVEKITTGDGGTPGNAAAPARTQTRPKEKRP